MAKSFLNQSGLSRGLRNNNPGNLRRTSITWQGKIPFAQSKDSSFEQFYELRWGIRAMMRDLINDIGKGSKTITQLINQYAPPHENNTAAYINSLVKSVGISADAVFELTEETLVLLCKAIVYVENGPANAAKITDADYRDALAILGMTLKKKVEAPAR